MATSQFRNLDTDTSLGGSSSSDYVVASQKAIKTYVDNHSGGGSVAIDNSTITKNTSDEIQAVAVIDQNTGIAKTWTGTQAEYDAIVTKDPETEYIITDDIGGPATVIAELAEGLNDKADVSALNTKTAHVVTEFQEPTAANNYTWYRKYADGWVEQGGWRNNTDGTITFPIAMSLTNQYTAILVHNGNTAKGEGVIHCYNKTSTGMSYDLSISTSGMAYVSWQVSGMAA